MSHVIPFKINEKIKRKQYTAWSLMVSQLAETKARLSKYLNKCKQILLPYNTTRIKGINKNEVTSKAK